MRTNSADADPSRCRQVTHGSFLQSGELRSKRHFGGRTSRLGRWMRSPSRPIASASHKLPPAVGNRAIGSAGEIGPGGFEPPFSDPKSDVLPLDEGPATRSKLAGARGSGKFSRLFPRRRPARSPWFLSESFCPASDSTSSSHRRVPARSDRRQPALIPIRSSDRAVDACP